MLVSCSRSFFLRVRRHPRSTLFPYTTLFRSQAKRAMVEAAKANVKRLEQLQSFEKIYAPFAGVVTARNTDVGQLVDSGSGARSEEHTSELQSLTNLVCRLLLEKKKGQEHRNA